MLNTVRFTDLELVMTVRSYLQNADIRFIVADFLLIKTEMKLMEYISDRSFDQERALYEKNGILLDNCRFEGEADGESALKECKNVNVKNCCFDLRYPLWHDSTLEISSSQMTENCRAAIWYSDSIKISDTKMHGIKALRECSDIEINGCDIISPEFGWSCKNVKMQDTSAQSEYFMMRSENLTFDNVSLIGKYSFQYIKNSVFDNCRFDTKDAFWHAENVLVKNSVVKGEYLAWYADGLTFENCIIIGTQPLCYCKGLRLVGCEMRETDLAFEKSEVNADITTPVISIKNPLSGTISVPSVGEIIRQDARYKGEIIIKDRR